MQNAIIVHNCLWWSKFSTQGRTHTSPSDGIPWAMRHRRWASCRLHEGLIVKPIQRLCPHHNIKSLHHDVKHPALCLLVGNACRTSIDFLCVITLLIFTSIKKWYTRYVCECVHGKRSFGTSRSIVGWCLAMVKSARPGISLVGKLKTLTHILGISSRWLNQQSKIFYKENYFKGNWHRKWPLPKETIAKRNHNKQTIL